MRHRGWMSTIAYVTGLAGLVNLALTPGASQWLPWIIGLYLLGGLTISVGYHRLFCHGAFKAHPFWHWFFATAGVLFMYGSPIQWSVTHSAHHKWSDTDRDPHPKPSTALFSKSYRKVPLDLWKMRRLLRQGEWHWFVDRNYANLWLTLVSFMAALNWEFVLYAYLPALGLAHLTGAIHNTFSHLGGKPRDWWFMEFILPAGGEWLHGQHHAKERLCDFRSRWYHLDPGALFIKLIRKRT